MTSSVRAAGAAVLVGAITMSPVFVVGATSPRLLQEIPGGASSLGRAIGAFFLATLVLSLVAGRITDKIGAIRAFRLCVLISVAATGAIAVLPITASRFTALMALAGVGNAFAGPVSSLLIIRFVRERPALVFGMKQAAVPLAAVVAGGLASIAASDGNWRALFLVPAAFAVFGLAGVVRPLGDVNRALRSLRTTCRARPAVAVGTAMFAISVVATSLSVFVVELLVSAGTTASDGALLFSMYSLATIGTRLTIGLIADLRPINAPWLTASFLLAGAAGCLLIATERLELIVLGGFLVFGFGWGWTGLTAHFVGNHYGGELGRAAGKVQAFAASGGVVGPPLLGRLVEHHSQGTPWIVAAAVCLFGSLVIVRASKNCTCDVS